MAMIGRGCFGNPLIFQQAKAVLEGTVGASAAAAGGAVRDRRAADPHGRKLQGRAGGGAGGPEAVLLVSQGDPHANYYKEQIVQMNTLEDVDRITKGIQRDLRD